MFNIDLAPQSRDFYGRTIKLSELRVPTLSLASSQDHIVPPETTLREGHLADPEVLTTLNFEGGHIGCFLGGRAQKQMWPKIAHWLKEIPDLPTKEPIVQ